MRYVVFLAVFASAVFAYGEKKDSVYVCMGGGSYAYHLYKDCEGLQGCGAEIKRVSTDRAKKMERRLCGFCRWRRKNASADDGKKVRTNVEKK